MGKIAFYILQNVKYNGNVVKGIFVIFIKIFSDQGFSLEIRVLNENPAGE